MAINIPLDGEVRDIVSEEIEKIQGDYYTATEVDEKLDEKQNVLTAGANITIVNDVISATGGGEGGGIPEAPTDGKQYGRQNSDWTEILPSPGPGPVGDFIYNVKEMFDFPSTAPYTAMLIKDPGGRSEIKISSDNDTEGLNPLTITPQLGYGPKYRKIVKTESIQEDTNHDYVTEEAMVTIEPEDGDTRSTINVPSNCNNFSINYFLGDASPLPPPPTPPIIKVSYWVDSNNKYHIFSLEDTPLENFCEDGVTGTYTINGVTVRPSDVRTLVFGESYDSVTEIPGYFLSRNSGLTNLYMPQNATRLRDGVLANAVGLNNVIIPPNLITIDSRCFEYSNISSLDLSNIKTIDGYFCRAANNLKYVKFGNGLTDIGPHFLEDTFWIERLHFGSLDAANIWAAGDAEFMFKNCGNGATDPVRYHSDLDLATKFLTKFPNLYKFTPAIDFGVNDTPALYLTPDYSWLG